MMIIDSKIMSFWECILWNKAAIDKNLIELF